MPTFPSKPRPKSNPFGSSINTRSYSAGSGFRFGFNGKEKQVEIGGDGYDFGARIYDGRLGRWMTIDKEFLIYPNFTTYSFAINKPLFFVDPDGNLITIHYQTFASNGAITNHYVNYTPGIKPTDNNEFVQNVHKACVYAMNSPTGKSYWTRMSTARSDGHEAEVTITERKVTINSEGNEFSPNLLKQNIKSNVPKNIGTILWDPKTEGEIVKLSGSGQIKEHLGYQSASTALFHEICHALTHALDPVKSIKDGSTDNPQYDSKSEEIVIKGPETKYVNEINFYEKSKVGPGSNYSKQSVRENHEWRPNIIPIQNPNDCTQVSPKLLNGNPSPSNNEPPKRNGSKT